MNGTAINTSSTYFNQNKTTGKAPNTTCSSLNIRPLARAVVVAYFDNVSATVTTPD